MSARVIGEVVIGYDLATSGETHTHLTVRGDLPVATVLGLLAMSSDSALKGAYVSEELGDGAKATKVPQFDTLPGLERSDDEADAAVAAAGTFQGALANLLDRLGAIAERTTGQWAHAPLEIVTQAAARTQAAIVRAQLASIEHEEGVVDAVAYALAGSRDAFYATDMEAADREEYRADARRAVAAIREADAS